MHRRFFILAAVLGFTGVLMGVIGAHVIKDRITPEKLVSFEAGVRYHLYHAVALLGVAAVMGSAGAKPRAAVWLGAAGWLFVAGVVLFSGSIYVYANTPLKAFAHVAPLGGISLMVGWLCLLIAGVRMRRD